MKIASILDSLKTRKLRFGGYATLLVVVGLAVVIAINVLVDQVPGKIDLTQNKLFSLSEATIKLLDGLKTDVTISMIGKEGSEDPTVKAILARYSSRNRHVKVQTIDPELKPGWTKQYDPTGQSISTGGLVVVAGPKYRTIGLYDMYNYDTSNYDPTNPNSAPQLTSLSVEQRVTSALLFVTAEKNVTLGVLEDHGEQTIDSLGLGGTVSSDNYAVKSVSLVTEAAVPSDVDILLILAPKSDLTPQDADKVRAYLSGGGRATILFDVLSKENELPNLAELLKSYGVEVRSLVVVEGDPNKMAFQNPYLIIPDQAYHDILSPLRANNYPIAFYGAQAVQTMELKKKSLKIEPLLTSSAKSYGKRDIANATSVQKESGDLPGPFTLAVAITDPATDTTRQDTKLVVMGDVKFLQAGLPAQVPGNSDFFMNSLGWLKGTNDTTSISIRPKSLQQLRLTLSNLQANILSGVVVILMPLLVLGAGFVVWVRRRHL